MPEPSELRVAIPDKWIEKGLEVLKRKLHLKLKEKGRGSLLSPQEIWGVIDEEMREFKDAVHDNNKEQVPQELLDMAVGCIFGYVCLMYNGHNMYWL